MRKSKLNDPCLRHIKKQFDIFYRYWGYYAFDKPATDQKGQEEELLKIIKEIIRDYDLMRGV